jgi:hypothetical protein
MNQHFSPDDTVYFKMPQSCEKTPSETVPGVVKEVFDSLIRVEIARKKRGIWTYEFRAVAPVSLSHRPKGSAPMDSPRLPLSFNRI